MKTKDCLLNLISSILNFVTFTFCSLIFLARKMPVFFALSVICVLCTILMICLCIKNIEIRAKDSDLEENKNGEQ